MYKQKIGISLESKYGQPLEEVMEIIKKIGFDAVSPIWTTLDEIEKTARIASRLGLELQSLHAPFTKAAALWAREGEKTAAAKKELFDVIDACERFGFPITVVHTWIGFEYEFDKAALYYGNFDEVVDYAASKAVKIAFENTEGQEFLFALMERYEGNSAVGFCWDSGHELCYNRSRDLLGDFGNRLIMTHLNDNLGISRYDGKIFWTDDLHLLPYDGIADWDHNIERLRAAKHMDILNFELTTHSKPNRHENDVYAKMSLVEYLTEAYKRACRRAYRYSK